MRDPRDPHHDRTAIARREGSLIWRWIAVGGCLVLLVVTAPVTISLLGMIIWTVGDEYASAARHAEATARAMAVQTPTPEPLSCYEVEPEVVAAIEARLTVAGSRLRGVQAVRLSANAAQWTIAAQVDGVVRNEGDDAIGVWIVSGEGGSQLGTPTSIAAVNGVAAQAGAFTRATTGQHLVAAATRCAEDALGR